MSEELISELNDSLELFTCVEFDKLKHDMCGISITQGAAKKATMIREFVTKIRDKTSQIEKLKNNLKKEENKK